MNTYYFGVLEFGEMRFGKYTNPMCLIHELYEVKVLANDEEAEAYASSSDLTDGCGDWIRANNRPNDEMEIVFAQSALYNGTIELSEHFNKQEQQNEA